MADEEASGPLAAVVAAGREALAPDEAERFAGFARALLSGPAPHRAVGATALAAFCLETWQVARTRLPDAVEVAVVNSDDRPGHTLIAIVQPDRPFLVDSVRMLLERRGLRERLFVHPVVPVERDGSGHLLGVGAGDAPVESIIAMEVVPQLDSREVREALVAELRELFTSVACVTTDYRRLVRATRDVQANVEFAGRHVEGGGDRAAKICRFLDWLVDGRFVFLGFRRYTLRSDPESGDLEARLDHGSGLGLWRDDATSRLRETLRGEEIPGELREVLEDPRIILIDKSRLASRIHRTGRLDRVIVKEHDERGRVCGFVIIGGLFSYRALRTPASQIPLLAERLEDLLAADGSPPDSHRYKAIVAAFDSAPVELLLGSDVEDVAALILEIVNSEGSHEPHLVFRAQPNGRACYAAILLPRGRYGDALRGRLRHFIAERTDATYVDDRVSFIEEGTAVLHLFCTASARFETLPDPAVLEEEIREISASWDDRLREELLARFGELDAPALAARYEMAFPETWRVITRPADAVRAVAAIEALNDTGRPQIDLTLPGRAGDPNVLTLFLAEERLLSDLLPIVDHFGIRVIDAQQARVEPLGRPPLFIESLRIEALGGTQRDLDVIAPRLGEALRTVLEETTSDDGLNALVLGAGLDWREVDLVRAYVEYFMQIQGTLARPFVRAVLRDNPLAVRLLVRLHRVRLDPDFPDAARVEQERFLGEAFEVYRDRVPSLNEDRALAGLYGLVTATLRTRFFAPPATPHRIAFKLDSSLVPELSGAQPYREIFVRSAAMMGVHLRGGPVARGGLRWSDRSDDLRVEILDLMRTQMLKNGLIVPVGAKGGFVIRRLGLPPADARREAEHQYRIFVSSLIDLTDSIDPEGRVVPPTGVHRRDGDDPYLVVAADKGTAHLSDTANAISEQHDFWLGDAFASGGSEGYDHKKYGITARGAWECVVHHFAELGVDANRDVFLAAGIGDMSGDVFGNGLLLARRAKLLAAFDHRHIFVDPDPDPDAAWQERKRLFELPGSSWEDYDATLLSEGGGVFPRSAKRIELSHAARARLGLGDEPLTGNAVVRAILGMPVDLLWNGGIGTYVKSAAESHVDVGDRANDAVRIDAATLRARVVGEGGNLGLTQAARIEAALRGVKLNTDAIDNSAGVDLSDHEVNYKILLAPLVRSGRLSRDERSDALRSVDTNACDSVLAHNREQALILSLDGLRSQEDLGAFARAIDLLCAPDDVDRDELRLPGRRILAQRSAAGQGLVRPELAVLLGLAKLQTRAELAQSPLVDDPALRPLLDSYFPPSFRGAWDSAVGEHRLRREITALVLTNRLLESGGVACIPSLRAELGTDVPTVASALLAAEQVLDARLRRERLISIADGISRETLYAAVLDLDRATRDVARFLARSGELALDRAAWARWRAGLETLREEGLGILSKSEARQSETRTRGLVEAGVPEPQARELAVFPLADRALNVVRIAERSKAPLARSVAVYVALGEASGINWTHQQLAAVPSQDLWDRMALVELRWDLLDLQRRLTERVLADDGREPEAAAAAFLAEHRSRLEALEALRSRVAAGGVSVSALSVIARRLRALDAV